MKNPLVLLLALTHLLAAADWHPSLPTPGSLDGLGVNIHFTKPEPGELEMIKAAGFHWVRQDITWASVERKAGEYDFSAYDGLAAALEKNGLKAYFILDYGNPLYADPGDQHPFTSRAGSEEFRTAYARWAAATVAHFAGRGYLFELWNEPNHEGFWKPKPNAAHYAAMAKATCVEIEKVAPKEALVGPATSTIDLPFIEECFRAGLLEHWCAVSVHPYRQQKPETVEAEYRKLRTLIRRYAPRGESAHAIPILSGEWGFSTAVANLGKDEATRERTQGQYLTRMFLTNITNDVPISIWYDWRDDGDNPQENEHRFGIVRRAFRKDAAEPFEAKPAYVAARTLTQQLAGMRLNKVLLQPSGGMPESEALIFSAGEKIKAVANPQWGWDPVSQPKRDVELLPGKYALTDWLGTPLAPQTFGPSASFSREQLPLYAIPQDAHDEWQVLAACPRWPLDIFWRFPASNPARDLSVDADKLGIVTNPLQRPISLLPDEAASDEKKAPKPLTISPGQTLSYHELRSATSIDGRSRYRALDFRDADRQPQPMDVFEEIRLSLGEKRIVAFEQPTVAICENPLIVTPLPPGKETLPVRIENPAGDAFHATLAAYASFPKGDEKVHSTPFEFVAGEKEKMVHLSVPLSGDTTNFWVKVFPQKPEPTAAGIDASAVFARVPLPSDEPVSIWADGAADTQAESKLANTNPPDGPALGQRNSLQLHYRFGAGWKFLLLRGKGAIPESIGNSEEPTALGLWLYGDGKGCQPRLRFVDATGQTFQPDGPKIDFTGWRYLQFPLQNTDDSHLTHWGGANDGEIHYPIKWDSLLILDNVSRQPVEGEIYLSAPTLIY